MLWITLVLVIVSEAVAQVTVVGNCPAFEIVPKFEVSKAMGGWFQFGEYYTLSNLGDRCVTTFYTLNKDGSVQIKKSGISMNGTMYNIKGITTPLSNAGAIYTIAFPSLGVVQAHSILATDYDTYGVVASCTNFGKFSVLFTWILTREPYPKDSVLKKAYAVLDKNKLNRAYFLETDQKNCPKSDW